MSYEAQWFDVRAYIPNTFTSMKVGVLGSPCDPFPFQMIKITQIIVRATLFYEIINKTFYPLIEQIIKLMSVLANVNYSLLILGAQ